MRQFCYGGRRAPGLLVVRRAVPAQDVPRHARQRQASRCDSMTHGRCARRSDSEQLLVGWVHGPSHMLPPVLFGAEQLAATVLSPCSSLQCQPLNPSGSVAGTA